MTTSEKLRIVRNVGLGFAAIVIFCVGMGEVTRGNDWFEVARETRVMVNARVGHATNQRFSAGGAVGNGIIAKQLGATTKESVVIGLIGGVLLADGCKVPVTVEKQTITVAGTSIEGQRIEVSVAVEEEKISISAPSSACETLAFGQTIQVERVGQLAIWHYPVRGKIEGKDAGIPRYEWPNK